MSHEHPCRKSPNTLPSRSYQPETPYTKALLSHLVPLLPTCPPDSLAQIGWAVSHLYRSSPPLDYLTDFLTAWTAAVTPAVTALSPAGLAAVAQSLAPLRVSPGNEFMTDLTRRASEVLGACSAAELTSLISGLADLRWRPSDAWLQVRSC